MSPSLNSLSHPRLLSPPSLPPSRAPEVSVGHEEPQGSLEQRLACGAMREWGGWSTPKGLGGHLVGLLGEWWGQGTACMNEQV